MTLLQPPKADGKSPEMNALGAVLDHGRELGEDFVGWVELRIHQAQLELYDRLDEKGNELINKALAGALAGMGGFLLLVAACLGIGAALGHPAWGFLIVGLLFSAVGFAFFKLNPHLKRLTPTRAEVRDASLEPEGPQGTPAPSKVEALVVQKGVSP